MVFVESSDSITQSLVSVREESLIYSAVIYAKYLLQGRHKVWKSGGGAWSTVVGIICPPGWDRVNYLAKNWGAKAPPPTCYEPVIVIIKYKLLFVHNQSE